MDAATGPSSTRIVRLSSAGETVISDLRDLGGAVSRAQLDLRASRRNLGDVRVSWAPALDGCIAVSGQFKDARVLNKSKTTARLVH